MVSYMVGGALFTFVLAFYYSWSFYGSVGGVSRDNGGQKVVVPCSVLDN